MNATTLRKRLSYLGYMLCWVAASAAAQQPYPARPIQIVVPFAAGGSIDIVMRWIAPGLSEQLGQQVVVVNRAGGLTTIGMGAVARSNPDGHTLGAASFQFAVNPFVAPNALPYDTDKDFEPVTLISRTPSLMVINPSIPVKSVKEFIAYARARPGELNYGSVGIASSGHLISMLFENLAGVKMVHVPVTAGPLPSLVANQIQLQFGPVPSTLPFVKAGKLVALGVSSLTPDPFLPGLPTIAKTVPGFQAYEWPGLVTPSGTPRAVIEQIYKAVNRVLANPDTKARLDSVSSVAVGSTPAEFRAFIKREMSIWEKVGRQAREAEATGR